MCEKNYYLDELMADFDSTDKSMAEFSCILGFLEVSVDQPSDRRDKELGLSGEGDQIDLEKTAIMLFQQLNCSLNLLKTLSRA